jgi:plastocyanin
MKLLPLILIALIVPFASACGGNDDDSSTADSPSASGQTIDVTATDFHFGPPALTAEAGTVTFKLTNNGSASHALTIEGNGIEETSSTIGAGDSTELTVDLAEGEYEIYCPVDGHKDMGMVGTLTVGSGGGATTTDDGGGATTTDDDGEETTTGVLGY